MANKSYRRFYMETKSGKLESIRNWADENRRYFPTYHFTNRNSDFPITHQIADLLEKKLGYRRVEEANRVILYMPKAK